ncbi:MAG: hypothetical protein AB7V46_11400, partial [Thermomicrobiales bacterium]
SANVVVYSPVKLSPSAFNVMLWRGDLVSLDPARHGIAHASRPSWIAHLVGAWGTIPHVGRWKYGSF